MEKRKDFTLKGSMSWRAETKVYWTDAAGIERQLLVTTYRMAESTELTTTASVGTVDGMFVRHMVRTDFHRWLKRVPISRLTDKVVEAQHAPFVNGPEWDKLCEEAKAFYAEVA
jgi:hypothetical protein